MCNKEENMMKMSWKIFGSVCISMLVCCCSVTRQTPNGIARERKYQPVRELFSLSDIRVTDRQMLKIQELDHDYLLSLDVDRLLSLFRKEAGLSQNGVRPYPYWESEDVWGEGPLAGHIMGFWLSSAAMMYQSTGDKRFIPLVEKALEGLRECQLADGEGFIGAQPGVKNVFLEVAAGRFTTSNPLVNHTWEPVYVMNKTMLGLYDVFLAMHLDLAKTILTDLADWFGSAVLDKLDDEQVQKLLVCEHGSINESFVDTYSITGEKRFLDWAERLNDEDMWVPAAQRRDILQGWHANTQIPKFTGFERVYTYDGNADFHAAARFFWQTVADNHTWVNGGNSTGEHFFPIGEFESRLERTSGPESCNSVNMMRLTEALYQDDGDMKYLDYYERVLLNHVLANYDPEEGMCVYYTSMRPGAYKIYSTKYDSFWCCTGSGMQAPAKFGKMIYSHSKDSLFVNLYLSSTLRWEERGMEVRMETDCPRGNKVRFTIGSCRGKSLCTIAFRKPWWSARTNVTLNGVPVGAENDGYLTISRKWRKGDEVVIDLQPELRCETVKGGSHYHAFLYGPVLLGARIDNPSLTKEDFRSPRRTVPARNLPLDAAPQITVSPEKVVAEMERADIDSLLRFHISDSCATRDFYLEPYNGIHFSCYAIYFHSKE